MNKYDFICNNFDPVITDQFGNHTPYFRIDDGSSVPAAYIGDNRIAIVTPGSVVNYHVWDFAGKTIVKGSHNAFGSPDAVPTPAGRIRALRLSIAAVKRIGADERVSMRWLRNVMKMRPMKLVLSIQTMVVVRTEGENTDVRYDRDAIERDIRGQFQMQADAHRIPCGYVGGTALIAFPSSVRDERPKV